MLQGLRNLFTCWKLDVYSTVAGGTYPLIDFEAVNKTDLFVLGGGELIRPDSLAMPTPCGLKFRNHSLAYKAYNHTFLAHLPWVKRVKTRKAILGCGVDAEAANQLHSSVLKDLAEFDYIGLRDTASLSILTDLPQLKGKVHYFPDLAFANKVSRHKKVGDYAAVVPTHRGKHLSRFPSELWLKEQLKDYGKAWFVPFGQKDNDDYYTSHLYSRCASEASFMHPNQVSLQSVTELFAGALKVVSYRLHGLILAFMVGVPYAVYPYHRKVERVFNDFGAFSLDEFREVQNEAFSEVVS